MLSEAVNIPPGTGRIAVLIPVYNDDGRLMETLRSLRQQGDAVTAVIVDDGSTPPLSVDRHVFEFPIVIIRQEPNRGIERALNRGLDYIVRHGFEYIARLDNGDLCAPQRLARQKTFLEERPDTALVGSNVEWRREDGTFAFAASFPVSHEAIARGMHHRVCLIHPAVMFRTHIVASLGGYSYAYPAAEDYEFFWRIARRFRVANIPETLLITRFDAAGISVRKRRRQLRSKLRIQLQYFRATEPLSYYGVLKTLALMCVPYRAVVRLKRFLNGRALPA